MAGKMPELFGSKIYKKNLFGVKRLIGLFFV
jgi:hypothetical protein